MISEDEQTIEKMHAKNRIIWALEAERDDLKAKQGFAGTSVRDIANACGILSGSIYHHFSAKEELVEEIFTAYFDELTARWDVVLTGAIRDADRREHRREHDLRRRLRQEGTHWCDHD